MGKVIEKMNGDDSTTGTHCQQEFTQSVDSVIPELELEWFQPVRKNNPIERRALRRAIRFALLGIGQCGCRIAKSFGDLGYRKVLAADTMLSDLANLELPERQKLILDIGRSGTGKNMDRGRDAFEKYQQDLFSKMEMQFGADAEHILICLGAGGGTGSGSIDGLIELAQQYVQFIGLRQPNRKVGILMTLPDLKEMKSRKVAHNTRTTTQKLFHMAAEGMISPLILVDNQKISNLATDITIVKDCKTINRKIAEVFDLINRLSALPTAYTTFDPTDYLSLLRAGGCMTMGLTEIEGRLSKNSIADAVRRNMKETLFATDYNFLKAKAAAGLIVAGPEMISSETGLQDSIHRGFNMLSALTGRATVHRGIYEHGLECLRVATVVSGLPPARLRLKK